MRRSLLGLCAASALLVAACGGGRGDEGVDAAGESTTTRQAVAPTTDSTPAAPGAEVEPPSANGCAGVIEALGGPDPLAPNVDALALITEDRLAGLQLPGHAQRELVGLDRFDAPEQLIFSSTAEPEKQLASLRDNRFMEGYRATYAFGPDSYSLFALAFPNPDGARAYHGVYLDSVCPDWAHDMRPLPNTSSGVTFLTGSGSDVYANAAVTVGRVELILSLCVCVETDDHRQVVTDWVAAITAQLSGRTPSEA